MSSLLKGNARSEKGRAYLKLVCASCRALRVLQKSAHRLFSNNKWRTVVGMEIRGKNWEYNGERDVTPGGKELFWHRQM